METLAKDIIELVVATSVLIVTAFVGIRQVRLWKADRKERKDNKCELHGEDLVKVKTELAEAKGKIEKLEDLRDNQLRHGMEIEQLQKDFFRLQRRIAAAFRRTNKKVDDLDKKLDDLPRTIIDYFDNKIGDNENELA